MVVIVREGESLDAAWRRLVREMVSNGVFVEYKKRARFIAPSTTKAEVTRYHLKTKRRHRSARRKLRSKGKDKA